MNIQNRLSLLEEGALLFTLLGRTLHGLPDRAFMSELVNQRVFEEVPFLPADVAEPGLSLLMKWTEECGDELSQDDFECIRAEYTRLFVGFRRVVAPLWESVYFNRDRMVFQKQTFQVRAMYTKYGLEIDSFGHEPDDHLAYELLFIAHLCNRCAEFVQTEEEDALAKTVADLISFTLCHPLSWVSKWSKTVQQEASTDFYRGYALLVESALHEVESILGAIAQDSLCA